MLHVDLTLAMQRLRHLSSPHVRTITILPCSKRSPKHLCAAKDWGGVCRRSQLDTSLPPSNFTCSTLDANLPVFPTVDSQESAAFLDAAHANDLRNRQSTTGYAFLLCGGAISYCCKTQSITATSSTEAEFLAAVATAKHARYMRAIMTDLGFPPEGPTVMCCDDQLAINVINARVPAERSRHIDIQHFAIQDWKDSGAIVMEVIPSVINPSDDLTKPLSWVSHDRHARRVMGHC